MPFDFSSLSSLMGMFQPPSTALAQQTSAGGFGPLTGQPLPDTFTGSNTPFATPGGSLGGISTALSNPSMLGMMLSLGSALAPEGSWQQQLSNSMGQMNQWQMLAKALAAPMSQPYQKTKGEE